MNDYREYSNNLKCPFCEEETLTTFYFHGTYIYVCKECTFIGLEYRTNRDLENLILFEELRDAKVKSVLNFHLENDDTDFGGVSFVGETVEDFIEEVGLDKDDSLFDLNCALVECGIKPIEEI